MHQSTETINQIKSYYYSGQLPLYIRGRFFGLREIRIIHQCIEANFEAGRTKISKEVCERLSWRQPNGWLKDRACRDVLRHLANLGLVELPPSKVQRGRDHNREYETTDYLQEFDLETPIISFPKKIVLEFAKSNKAEILWNQLVDRYHYLGHKVSVGRTIKYLIRSEDKLLGAISFSSATWHLNARKKILSELGYPPETHLDIVINNTRFLILPNVTVEHLASKLLSIATKQVVADWTWYYSIEPQFVETFVEPSRFDGTSYKAANWIEIGKTRGYAKKGASYYNSQEPKAIYIYGLNKQNRRHLKSLLDHQKL